MKDAKPAHSACVFHCGRVILSLTLRAMRGTRQSAAAWVFDGKAVSGEGGNSREAGQGGELGLAVNESPQLSGHGWPCRLQESRTWQSVAKTQSQDHSREAM